MAGLEIKEEKKTNLKKKKRNYERKHPIYNRL